MEEPRTPPPFPGLRPYGEADREYFYGRDGDCRIIAANFLMAPLTVLYGPSGAGKSSLLNAGVAPILRKERRTRVVIFRKWSGPGFLEDLKTECAGVAATAGVTFDLTRPLDDLLLSVASAINSQILIILDQFEEYLLYHTEADATEFETQFAQVINREEVPVNFLLSLREDWYYKLERFRARIPYLFRHAIRLSYLNSAAAREAIERPLAVYNTRVGPGASMEVEPALIETVIRQAQSTVADPQAGGTGRKENASEGIRTPLLQLMMVSVWEEEKRLASRCLRRSTLDALGGAEKIFTRHVDEAMNALTEPERRISANIFDYMVTPTGSKIAQSTEDLVSRAQAGAPQVRAVLEELSRQRIVSRLDRPERYEIFHDVLAPAVLDWRNRYEKRRQIRAHRRLLLVASGLLVYFVVTATGLIVFQARARRAQEGQKVSLSRELTSRALSISERDDPELAVLLALHALRVRPTGDAEAALEAEIALTRAIASSRIRAILSGHTGAVQGISVSPDGSRIATASADRTVRLWDRSGRTVSTLSGHTGPVADVVFSSDGTLLASAGEDGNIVIWDVDSGRNLRVLSNESAATRARFHPRSHLLASGAVNGTVKLWDADSGRLLLSLTGHSSRVRGLAFSPDGRRLASADVGGNILVRDTGGHTLATGSDSDGIWSVTFSPDGQRLLTCGAEGVLKVWATQGGIAGTPLARQAALGNDLLSAAVYNPSGSRIAVAGWDHTARLLDGESGQELMVLRGHTGSVLGIVFAPDGKSVITASQDSTARLWDISTDPESQEVAVVAPGQEKLSSVAFDPKGNRIAAGGLNGSLIVWPLNGIDPLFQIAAHNGFIFRVAFSADGRRLATASSDRTAVIRDGNTGRAIAPPLVHGDAVSAVAFSPDNRLLATASWDHTAAVWDAAGGNRTATLHGHTDGVTGVAFSPDSKLVATASLDGSAKLWDGGTGRELLTFTGHSGRVFDIAFSPDGKRIASAGEDGSVRIWNAASAEALLTIPAHNNWVHTVAFSPDGTLLLTAGRDGDVKVWSAGSGRLLLDFSDRGGKVYQAVFSPDSARIARVAEDGTLRVNALQRRGRLAEVVALARSRLTRSMTSEECRQFLPGLECPDLRRPDVRIPVPPR